MVCWHILTNILSVLMLTCPFISSYKNYINIFSRWESNHQLMIENKVNKSLLKEMVAHANIQFRYNAYTYKVSLLVFPL